MNSALMREMIKSGVQVKMYGNRPVSHALCVDKSAL